MSFKKLFLLLCMLILTSAYINSDENYDDLFEGIDEIIIEENEEEVPKKNNSIELIEPDFSLKLKGDQSFRFHIPVMKDHLDFQGYKAPRFENEIGAEIKYKILKVVTEWKLDLIINDTGNFDDILSVIPLENYIKWSPWKFDIAVGLQNYSWGTGDGINPTNNLNSFDYTKDFEPLQLPVLSASLTFYPIDQISLSAIYIPFAPDDKLPLNFESELAAAIPYPVKIKVDNPDFDARNFILGGKVSFFLQYADFSFSYIYDLDSMYTPEIDVTGPMIEEITLKKRRIHQIGTDMRSNIDIFGIWAEINYSLTEDYFLKDYKVRNHKLSYVAGFDFNYGPDDNFYFNLQYTGSFIPNYYTKFYKDYEDGLFESGKDRSYYEKYYYRFITDYLGGYTEGLVQGAGFNMKWAFMDSLLTPSISAFYNLPILYDSNYVDKDDDNKLTTRRRFGNVMINTELDIKPLDSFHIKIGSNLIFGLHQIKGKELELDKEDFIGINYKNNNIYIEVTYEWNYKLEK